MTKERCQFWAKWRFLKVGSYLRKISKAEVRTHELRARLNVQHSRFVYIKIHVILHVTSKAQKVYYIWLDKFISYVIRLVWQNQVRAELSGSVDHNFCSLLRSKWLLLTQRKSRRWNYVSLVRFLIKFPHSPILL